MNHARKPALRTPLKAALLAVLALEALAAFTPTLAEETTIGKSYRLKDKAARKAQSRALGPAELSDADKQRFLSLVNDARAQGRQCGAGFYAAVPPVSWNSSLENAAQRHSNDMAIRDFFSHTGSDGSTPADRVSNAGYRWRAVAENIAAGYTTPDSAVQTWLNSPGHCANIMGPDYRHLGVAKALNLSGRYRIYWTQLFAAPR